MRTLILALAATLSVASAVQAQHTPSLIGVWRNPKNSVHVDIQPCGDRLCGVVVWASEKAKQDSKEGGTPNLVGTQLFRDFGMQGNGVYRGRVFIPDLGWTLGGTATQVDPDTLRARGCLVICKSQVWKRVS
ncbi:DUF2147 domain-containing protein [Phenylobacterium immobile]|uniref:DUF2147 domain-containing protein n=1 Tax=Phenylobacterium immobile TaxID=21 RepID=UPI000AB56C95|nr:DUF2147 domain-containing protein [Phenylobacterium immobile]